MTLDPIFSAGSATPVHPATISAAFVIGSWITIRPEGTSPHRCTMIGVYAGGIWIAGLFTLLPGRLLHEAVFGS